jgi:hypothetical protein
MTSPLAFSHVMLAGSSSVGPGLGWPEPLMMGPAGEAGGR